MPSLDKEKSVDGSQDGFTGLLNMFVLMRADNTDTMPKK